jgi:glycine cleavage system H lipoate-binding protein
MSSEPEKKSKLIATSAGQCVWAEAGVISYRLCTLNYQCERCSLHQALVDGPVVVQPPPSPSVDWAQAEQQRDGLEKLFSTLPASARKCRHMLTGDVSYKLCINVFRCVTCSFAQMMEDSAPAEPDLVAGDSHTIEGLHFPGGLHYHRSHSWVRVERNGDVRMGLDDFGQWLLGDVRQVRVPECGEGVFEGATACEFRLNTGQIGVMAPVSGRVIARNERLLEQPGLVNESPYTQGWLLMVRPFDLSSELISLLYGQEARRWLELEVGRIKEKSKWERTGWKDGFVREIAGEFLLAEMKKAA